MAGIFTQKRQILYPLLDKNGNAYCRYKLRFFFPENRDIVQTRLYSQTTVSFRNSDPAPNTEIDPNQLIAARKDPIRVYDRGHEFSTVRAKRFTLSRPRWDYQTENGEFWSGPLMVSSGMDNMPYRERDYPFSPIDLQYGTKAIKNTIPTKSEANISQAIAELKRDLPKIPALSFFRSGKKFNPNNIGNEYLNWVFGVAPTIRDLQDVLKAIDKFDVNLQQYIRDSGQIVRRRYDFAPKTTVRTVFTDPQSMPDGMGVLMYRDWVGNFFNDPYDAYGTLSLTEELTERYWFSGAYTYYLASLLSEGGAYVRGVQLARKLLGIDGLTPTLAYELAPWSWLLDWFANVGDLISNGTAFSRDGLVIRWGYLMRETRVKRTYTHSGVKFKNHPTGPFTMTEEFTQKLRVKATPFGFGLNPDTFTDNQWAILIALGLTNGNKSLL